MLPIFCSVTSRLRPFRGAARRAVRVPRLAAARLAAAAALALLCAGPVAAQGPEARTLIGVGRLFTNDLIGDGHDRWRSGSTALSFVRGPAWTGRRPDAFGALLEYRLRSEILGPVSDTGRPGDRPYVGALSFGIHSHWTQGGRGPGATEASLGVDVTVVGPQTRVSDFQVRVHDRLSLPGPYGVEDQIANSIHAGLVAELARPLRLSDRLTLRPFAEAQYGVEEIARAGFDVIYGGTARQDLLLRDLPSGQLYRAVAGPGPARGYALVAGFDAARVGDSIYLPRDLGYRPEPTRLRARAGVHLQIRPGATFFYGLTWLSQEFEGQPEGQVVGSIKLNFRF